MVLETLATSQTRLDALTGPGKVADNEYGDPNREGWVNKPTKRHAADISSAIKV